MAEVADLKQFNPYGLTQGQPCDHVRIVYLHQSGAVQGWDGVISLPPNASSDWEDLATQAFLWAKKIGGLEAGMMAFCSFSYLDDEVGGWVQFM